MKMKGNKMGSSNGLKTLRKGAKQSHGGFKKGKKSKVTGSDEKPGEKNIAFKKKLINQNTSKRNKKSSEELSSSKIKRKAEHDSEQVKKKMRVHKEEGLTTRLERKEIKVARKKRKHNYELSVSLIKKYDGLRRYADCNCKPDCRVCQWRTRDF